MTNYDLEKNLEKKIIDELYNNDYERLYNLYIWQQYLSGDDVFCIDDCHPLKDNLRDAINEGMKKYNGYIYVAEHPNNDYYKVGMTRNNPENRIKSLNQAGVFDHLTLIKSYYVNDIRLENIIHQQLELCTPFKYKEFFKTSLFIIDDVIRAEINEFNHFFKELY